MKNFLILFFTFTFLFQSYPLFAANTLSPKRIIVIKNALPVDINHASVKDLMTLKGIGEKKAAAIVDYRENKGDFKSVDDLANVDGFSQKTVEHLKAKNPGRVMVSDIQ